MAMVSLYFLVFVAVTAVFYFLIPQKGRWGVLLAASMFFYWMNSGWLLLVLVLSALFTYGIGRRINTNGEKEQSYLDAHREELTAAQRKDRKQKIKKKNRRWLLLGVVVDLSVLLVLKYNGFFLENGSGILRIFGVQTSLSGISFLLPLGISFYTLQAIAYMTDVYRGKTAADTNPFQFLLFMSWFPQITQGPIARHDQLAGQLYTGHAFDYQRIANGAQRILWGFMKKLILADRIAIPVNEIFQNSESYGGLLALGAAVGYGLQVYADFSGGMDIASGVSEIFGITLEQNFRQPYFSGSIEEFWRRWHITLGAWMKDYVFYPLSLSKAAKGIGRMSRKWFGVKTGKKVPAFLAMFLVYFFVGFWHGAEWKYILYGLWNGIFIMSGILLEERYAAARCRLHIRQDAICWKFFTVIRTFLLCAVGRFFSRASNCRVAFQMIGSMFLGTGAASLSKETVEALGLSEKEWIVVGVFLLLMLLVDALHERGIAIRETIGRQNIVIRWLIYYAAIFAVLIFGVYGSMQESTGFIYQQF